MPTFSSSGALEGYIKGKAARALQETKIHVIDQSNATMDRFYNEYEPSEYMRTGWLRGSMNSDSVPDVAGLSFEITFEPDRMHHYRPTAMGKSGAIHSVDWDEGEILENSFMGSAPHGGWPPAGGAPIWPEIERRVSDVPSVMRDALMAQGLPIK